MVVVVEPPASLCVRIRERLRQYALENVRLATADELISHDHVLKALRDLASELESDQGRPGYEDHTESVKEAADENDKVEGTEPNFEVPIVADPWGDMCKKDDAAGAGEIDSEQAKQILAREAGEAQERFKRTPFRRTRRTTRTPCRSRRSAGSSRSRIGNGIMMSGRSRRSSVRLMRVCSRRIELVRSPPASLRPAVRSWWRSTRSVVPQRVRHHRHRVEVRHEGIKCLRSAECNLEFLSQSAQPLGKLRRRPGAFSG